MRSCSCCSHREPLRAPSRWTPRPQCAPQAACGVGLGPPTHDPVWGDPAGLELASGGVRSLHADFVQAWDQDALEREVRACLNLANVCGVVSNRATG